MAVSLILEGVSGHHSDRRKDILFLAILSCVTVATFWKTFIAGYVYWDDNVFILENALLKEPFWTAVKAFFGNYYHADYLPLPLTTYWIEVHLFGYNAGVQHAVNLFLHLGNIILFYVYLSMLGLPKNWIKIICAVFAIHPVQTEPLMWMSNRNIFLCTIFLLSACCMAQWNFKTEKKKLSYGLLCSFYLLAFFCKSTGLLLPLVLIAADMSYRDRNLWQGLKRYAPLLVVAVVAIYFRTLAYSEGVQQNFSSVTWNPHRLVLVPIMAFNALALYVKMLFVPWGYTIIYPRFSLDAASIGGAVFALLLSVGLFYLWKRSRRRDYLFFSSLVMVFLLPVLQILPRINYINDRYLYIPIVGMVGLLLAAVADLPWRPGKKFEKVIQAAGAVFILTLPFFSYAHSGVWVTDKSLWEDTVAKNPTSVLARNNLGLDYQRENDLDHAVEIYRSTVALGNVDGALSTVFNNLGTIYGSVGSGKYYDLNAAEQAYENGLKTSIKEEDTYTLYFNLAIVEVNLKNREKAVQILSALARRLQQLSDRKYDGLLQLTQKTLQSLQGPT